jgi:hypothetical protein
MFGDGSKCRVGGGASARDGVFGIPNAQPHLKFNIGIGYTTSSAYKAYRRTYTAQASAWRDLVSIALLLLIFGH